MSSEMMPIEIIGLKTDLPAVLHTLQQLGCVHIDDTNDMPQVRARRLRLDSNMLRQQEEISVLAARIGGLLDTFGTNPAKPPKSVSDGNTLAEARKGIEELLPIVQNLNARREQLESELASLPRYEATLRKLLPIVPHSAQDPANRMTGILVKREYIGELDNLGTRVLDITAGRAEVVASDVDADLRAMLVVFPDEFTSQVETLLGHEDVSRLRLPSELGQGRSPAAVVDSLQERIASIPKEISAIKDELSQLSDKWYYKLSVWRALLQDELESTRVLSHFGETDMTFVLAGWIPKKDIEKVKTALRDEIGDTVFIKTLEMAPDMEKRARGLLRSPTVSNLKVYFVLTR